MELPKITPVIQFATAAFALAVGGYSAGEKFGWFKNEILVWSPEHFRIESAKIGHPVTVTVARIKKRDDCSVENFEVTVRDGAGVIHQATPSMTLHLSTNHFRQRSHRSRKGNFVGDHQV